MNYSIQLLENADGFNSTLGSGRSALARFCRGRSYPQLHEREDAADGEADENDDLGVTNRAILNTTEEIAQS